MHIHLNGHTEPSDSGAPQVVAAGFALLGIFMLILPLARISFEGSLEPRALIFLLKTDAGFNIFALLLLLAPIVGIAEAMLARSTWRLASASVALIAAILVPLALFALSRGTHRIANGMLSISPGPGWYVLFLGYLIIAVSTGIVAWRAGHV